MDTEVDQLTLARGFAEDRAILGELVLGGGRLQHAKLWVAAKFVIADGDGESTFEGIAKAAKDVGVGDLFGPVNEGNDLDVISR